MKKKARNRQKLRNRCLGGAFLVLKKLNNSRAKV